MHLRSLAPSQEREKERERERERLLHCMREDKLRRDEQNRNSHSISLHIVLYPHTIIGMHAGKAGWAEKETKDT